jgi:hypothetical protein
MSPIQVTDGIDPVLEEGGGVYARKDSLADGLAKVRPGKEASEAPHHHDVEKAHKDDRDMRRKQV